MNTYGVTEKEICNGTTDRQTERQTERREAGGEMKIMGYGADEC